MPKRRSIARSLALATAGLVAGGCQPDLQLSSLTATAEADDWIIFEYEIANAEPDESKPWQLAAPAQGPILVQAWTSSNDVEPEAPASVFYAPIYATERLEPGATVQGVGVASGNIDLTERPYLFVIIDPREQRVDRDRSNNVRVARVAPPASGLITERDPRGEPRTVEVDQVQPFVEAEVAPIAPDAAETPGTPRAKPMPKPREISPDPAPEP
jgi:hypothetical protein